MLSTEIVIRQREYDALLRAKRELAETQHQLGIVKAILAKVEDERNELLKAQTKERT